MRDTQYFWLRCKCLQYTLYTNRLKFVWHFDRSCIYILLQLYFLWKLLRKMHLESSKDTDVQNIEKLQNQFRSSNTERMKTDQFLKFDQTSRSLTFSVHFCHGCVCTFAFYTYMYKLFLSLSFTRSPPIPLPLSAWIFVCLSVCVM